MGNYAFIDSQNLNLETKKFGWSLDFQRFFIYLKAKYRVKKAFLFLGYIPKNKTLYENLRRYGYKLVFKPVIQYPLKESIKGNVDAELVLHSAKIEYENYEKAIIISNDGDFYCLVKFLIEENKLLKLLTPSQKYSSLLRRFSSFITPITLFRHKVEYTKKRAFPRHG